MQESVARLCIDILSFMTQFTRDTRKRRTVCLNLRKNATCAWKFDIIRLILTVGSLMYFLSLVQRGNGWAVSTRVSLAGSVQRPTWCACTCRYMYIQVCSRQKLLLCILCHIAVAALRCYRRAWRPNAELILSGFFLSFRIHHPFIENR